MVCLLGRMMTTCRLCVSEADGGIVLGWPSWPSQHVITFLSQRGPRSCDHPPAKRYHHTGDTGYGRATSRRARSREGDTEQLWGSPPGRRIRWCAGPKLEPRRSRVRPRQLVGSGCLERLPRSSPRERPRSAHLERRPRRAVKGAVVTMWEGNLV